jgi:uncharacterized delta-60 repeat protein
MPAAGALALATSLLAVGPAFGAGGSLDPTFGAGGTVIDVQTSVADGQALVMQPDGKLVVAGSWSSVAGGASGLLVARYDPDGSPDPTFGSNGGVAVHFIPGRNGSVDRALAVALQADGKIVVAGTTTYKNNSDFALARFTATGEPDGDFGIEGMKRDDFGGSDDVATGLVLLPNGKIIASGYTNGNPLFFPWTGYDFALARYNADGSVDDTFEGQGHVTTDFDLANDRGRAIAAFSTIKGQKLVVVGSTGDDIAADFALVGYNVDGSLDSDFGVDGRVTLDISGKLDEARGVAIQGGPCQLGIVTGKIVVAGRTTTIYDGHTDMVVARYGFDGTLDTTFGVGGTARADFASRDDRANALAIQENRKIVLAGLATVGDANDSDQPVFGLARFTADGELDPSFGFGGKVITDLSPSELVDTVWTAEANDVALDAKGKIVAAGLRYHTISDQQETLDIALARYLPGGEAEEIDCLYPEPRGR